MTTITIYILLGILILATIFYLLFKRNYFNKHKYIRVVTYNQDKTETIQYFKRDTFNKDNEILLINSNHVYNCNGYQTLIKTSEARESINPIDFEARYPAKKYKTAIDSKAVKDAFNSMKVDKFDKITLLLILNAVTLLAIAYLLYNILGSKGV